MDLIAYWWHCCCRCCGRDFLSRKSFTKTCSAKCRKMRSRWLSGERTPLDATKCREAYDRKPRGPFWGHHDDVLFQQRARL
jgi:hypothetical protein